MAALIGALRVDLGLNTAAFHDGLKRSTGGIVAFAAGAKKLLAPVAIAGAAAATGIGLAVKGTIDAADDMSKAAAKFGIPIETLSRLAYAGDLSGVSLDTLGTSVSKLSRQMADAAAGSKSAIDAFANVGVEFANADGGLRDADAVLQDLADRFAAMPDGAAKTAAAMELMGRGGAAMIPMLNGGSEALRKMMAEASTFGQVFDAEMGGQAEQFNDNISRLQGSFGKLAADLTKQLLPHLAAFSEWMVANGPAVANAVARMVEFGAAFVPIGQAIAQGIKIGGDALVAFAGEVRRDAEAIASFAASVRDGMAAAATAVANGITAMEQAFVGLRAKFVQVGRDLIAGLIEGLSGAVGALWSKAQEIGGGLVDRFNQVFDRHSPSRVFADMGRDLMAGLSGGLTSMQGHVQGEAQSFASSLASTFAGVLTGAQDFRDALSGILSQAGGSLLQAGIGGLFGNLPGFASGTRYAPGGWSIVGEHGPEAMNVPRGSTITPNSQLAGLGGASHTFAPVYNVQGADAAQIAQLRAENQKAWAEYRSTFRDSVHMANANPRFRGRL